MMSLALSGKRALASLVRPTRATWLLAAGILLVTLGAKYLVIDRYGSDIPNWDQWDAEEENLLLPYFGHRLGFAGLFIPHNEHRIAPTKALNLALTLINGQWDARLECTVNAILHSLIAVGVFAFGRRFFPDRRLIVWTALVLVTFAAPLAWTNILGGFHSQQYFLVGFSLVAIGLLVEARPPSPRWFAGVACMAGALVSMGAGFFASIALVFALLLADGPLSLFRRHLATLLVCVGMTIAGWKLHVEVSYHEPLKAHSLREFFTTVWYYLQWPLHDVGWFAAISFLPWALLSWRVWRQRDRIDTREIAVVAAGAWVLLQIAASAYARGAGGGWPADRYLDSLTIGLLANGAAILILWRTDASRQWIRLVRMAIFVTWVVSATCGVAAIGGRSVNRDLPSVKDYLVKAERCVRAYLATGDDRFLDDENRPYPGKQTLIDRLAHAEIRAILPASIRIPLKISGTSSPPGAFVVPPADYKFAAPWTNWRSGGPFEPSREGEWRSDPLPRGNFPYWRFDVTGHPGSRGMSLEIVERGSEKRLETVQPRRDARDAWRHAFVHAPAVDAVLVARDAVPEQWLGFTEPVEVARLSLFAIWLVKQGIIILVAGVILMLLGTTVVWKTAPATVATGPAPSPEAGFTVGESRQRTIENWRRIFVRLPQSPAFAAVATLVGMLIIFVIRRPDGFLRPQIWAEDGVLFWLDAMHAGLSQCFEPYSGYVHLLPRIAGWIGSLVDPCWLPATFAFCSWAAFAAAGAQFFSPRVNLPFKPLLALAIAAVPQTGEVFLNITNINWVAALLLVVLIVKDDARNTRQHATDAGLAILSGLSGPISILFLPLFAWRAWRRRTQASLAIAGIVAGCAIVQGYMLVKYPPDVPEFGPSKGVGNFLAVIARRLVFSDFAGWRIPGESVWVVGLCGLVVLAVLFALACRKDPLREMKWLIWACLLLVLGAASAKMHFNTWHLVDIVNGDRYFFVPKVLLLWLVVLELRSPRPIALAATAIMTLAVVLNASTWRLPALPDYHWENYCDQIRRGERVEIPINPAGWTLHYPGRPH